MRGDRNGKVAIELNWHGSRKVEISCNLLVNWEQTLAQMERNENEDVAATSLGGS